MKKGFTLAEVLITLGIIGVVAALTMPSLIQNYKRKEATARLKKFYSTMSQAVMLAEIEQGLKVYEWPDISRRYDESDASEVTQMDDDAYNYWNKYFAKHVKSLKIEKGAYNGDTHNATAVYFADGSKVTFHLGQCVDLLFDVNGDKKPNELGRDQFKFLIATPLTFANGNLWELYTNQSFGVGWLPARNTREKALDGCKTDRNLCATLLQYDNFEFKDDYPYRL